MSAARDAAQRHGVHDGAVDEPEPVPVRQIGEFAFQARVGGGEVGVVRAGPHVPDRGCRRLHACTRTGRTVPGHGWVIVLAGRPPW